MVKISIFFRLFRKKGTKITLSTLWQYGKEGMLQSDFLKKLRRKKNDLNAYFRVKKDLIKYKLIGFEINKEAKKVIFLTYKGKKIYNNIQEIESELKNQR
ncbi:MAG: hypothetical protein GF364_03640 [Candidatus Lokiarchaeota archaeon]|nr:hypothetical protein [Candidatus Lokiarchaeota archaeon]